MKTTSDTAARERPWLHGCGTALVTPFQADGAIDEDRVRALVRRQVAAGIHFLVPGGSTGEGVTLSRSEKVRVTELTVEAAGGAVPVIAGCGGNDTAEVVALARSLDGTGAAGLLVVTPYYNKPTPDGLFLHYSAIAEATSLPIVVYNVPSRTGINVTAETLARLATIPGVAAVKEAAGDIMQMARVVLAVPPDFAVLSGDDGAALPAMALGGARADLGGLQPDPRADGRAVRPVSDGGLCRRPPGAPPLAAAHGCQLFRDQPGTGEVLDGRDGPDRGRLPSSAGRGRRRKPAACAGGDGVGRTVMRTLQNVMCGLHGGSPF